MASEWFYAKDGKQFGPVAPAELKGMATSGLLDPTDLIWKEGMADWKPANSVANLFSAAPAVSASTASSKIRNPYAAPRTIDDETLMPGDLQYASFGRRLAATFADGFVAYAFILFFAFVISSVVTDPSPGIALIFIFVLSIALLLPAAFEASKLQATPGKLLLGIKVTNLAGRRISVLNAFGRQIAKGLSLLFFGIGFLMAGMTQKRQGLHDMIAGTLVVRSR